MKDMDSTPAGSSSLPRDDLSVKSDLPRAVLPALKRLGFFLRDLRSNLSIGNELWRELGYQDASLFGERWLDMVHLEDRAQVRSRLALALAGSTEQITNEFRVRAADGRWRWVNSTITVVSRDAANSAVVYVGREVDVTDRRELEQELATAREAAERRAEETETLRQVGVILASAMSVEDSIEAVLEQAHRVIPYRSAGVYMQRDGVVALVGGSAEPGDVVLNLVSHDEDIGRLELCTEQGHELNERELELLKAFADQVAVALRASRLYDETLSLAMTDPLTGLSTRRAFEHAAARRVSLAKRDKAPVSVMMIDIDYFKELNDCYGHASGDAVLQAVGEAFRDTLRDSDHGCRYGGDEFVVLLPETRRAQAEQVAERLRCAVQRIQLSSFSSLYSSQVGKNAPQQVTLSIGISCRMPGRYRSIADFLVTADKALYTAKRAGRNQIAVLEGSPDAEASSIPRP